MNKQQQAEAVFAELDICQDGWITKGELSLSTFSLSLSIFSPFHLVSVADWREAFLLQLSE